MKQRKFYFLFILPGLIMCTIPVYGQSTLGARSVAMGQTGVALPGDQWALFLNTSLLQADENQVSFYGFRYIGISELTDLAASTTIQTPAGTIGAGVHRFGYHLFNENRFRLGYKYQFDDFHSGISVSYIHIMQGGDYGSAGAIGIDAGLAAQLFDVLWFGARATNLNQPTYNSSDEEVPRELVVGMSYLPGDGIIITAELVKDVRFPISVRSGIEVEMINSFYGRTGITTVPETYSGGFGYKTSQLQINFGFQQHIPLGLSPALDMSLAF